MTESGNVLAQPMDDLDPLGGHGGAGVMQDDDSSSSDISLRSDGPDAGDVRRPQEETGYGTLSVDTVSALHGLPALTEAQFGSISQLMNFGDDMPVFSQAPNGREMVFNVSDVIQYAVRLSGSLREVIRVVLHPDVSRGDICQRLMVDYVASFGAQLRREDGVLGPRNPQGRVSDMPFRVKNELSLKLSYQRDDGRDWRGLADILRTERHLVDLWGQRQENPGNALLRHWQVEAEATLSGLYDRLLLLGRNDLATILES